MALKDILVHVDASRAAPRRVQAAMELAREHDSHLTGLHVMDIPPLPTYAEAQIPESILSQRRRGFEAQMDASEKLFQELTGNSGLSAEWRGVEGRLVDTLNRQGRYVDLIVLGQAEAGDPLAHQQGLTDEVALESGRPVLVIPAAGAQPALGERVIVAWDGKREAVRAVGDALPILETAKAVTIVTVNPEASDPGRGNLAADMCLHLARHGISAEAKSLHGATAAIGSLLLDTARDEGADLLVMGAYGHSRWRELVLGGVTSHVLSHCDIPVLLAH